MKEKWMYIEGSDDCYVSSLGNLKYGNKKIKQRRDPEGYPRATIKGIGTERTHRLVAKAFIPNPENKPVVNHINCIKHDNRVENLEWVTYAENTRHAIDTGLKKPTPGSSQCTFTIYSESDVIKVCELLQEGKSPKSLSREYNYGYDFIQKIRRGITWRHISQNYKFPIVRRYSGIFTLDEMRQMDKLFDQGMKVRNVIDAMNWEYNEQIRCQVKYQKERWKYDKIYEARLKPL